MKVVNAPMGWNSWDCYGAAVTEDIVRKNAKFMADNLRKYGWEYIVVDIQWYEPSATNHEYHPFTELCMDEYSRLIPAPNRFPSSEGGKGFGPLAEYVHSLGLKFGIHIMRGIPREAVHKNMAIKGTDRTARQIAKTASICQWNTDMYGVDPEKEGAKAYYDSIFELYASWGVDFIKCDDIAREFPHAQEELILLSQSLHNCGRDMILSLSPGPAPLEKAELFKQISNMWRITDDFWDQWELLYDMFERAEKWCTHTGEGHFPDADMLPIGPIRQDYDKENRTEFTKEEQITMMTLWSIFRSPLIIGGEMTGFDKFTMDLLTNEEILKMHKNARCAHQVWRREIEGIEHILWRAASVEGGWYVAVFNTGSSKSKVRISLRELEIQGKVSVSDLWGGEKTEVENAFTVELDSHGAKAFYLKKAGRLHGLPFYDILARNKNHLVK
ncbi:MAG: glycoside hydrolase family 27 protein [Lachnospiraceae bacterium]|nr:glycoside hydrolase family 27 protein [Lachnospiraceae bacterium]